MRPMRSFPRLLVPLLVLSALVTGCLGGNEPAANADAAPQDVATNATLDNVTVDDGKSEMPTDLGQQPHIHDYWKDRERVTLMDEEIDVDAPTALFWTFFDAMRGTPGVGGASIRLPEGATVYQGTGQLEFTASWTDATVTGMGMQYRSPADTQWSAQQEVKTGAPILIDVTPEMSDMPHAKTSRWQFQIMPAQAGQSIAGKFRVKIDVIRMGDITTFPGHPQLFNGEQTLTIFKGAGSSSQNNFAVNIVNLMTGAQTDDGVRAQTVVPMETRSMTANLTLKAASSDVGKAANAYLLVKPADRNRYSFLQAQTIDDSKQLYQFAWLVDMAQTDSPYSTESDWKFDVYVTTDQGALGENGFLANVKVDYELEVVAYTEVVDGAEDLGGGGRGG